MLHPLNPNLLLIAYLKLMMCLGPHAWKWAAFPPSLKYLP